MARGILLTANLPQLQNLIKRDPAAYKEEFLQQWNHYNSIRQIFQINPDEQAQHFRELVTFISQVDQAPSAPHQYSCLWLARLRNAIQKKLQSFRLISRPFSSKTTEPWSRTPAKHSFRTWSCCGTRTLSHPLICSNLFSPSCRARHPPLFARSFAKPSYLTFGPQTSSQKTTSSTERCKLCSLIWWSGAWRARFRVTRGS